MIPDPATQRVGEFLATSTGVQSELWEQCSGESAESFKDSAWRKLGDQTEVSSADLKAADWEALYKRYYG